MTDPRVRILQAAIGHTAQSRPSVYGKPHPNMSAQMALVDAYLAHSKGLNGRAHEMAIISLLIKIGRIASGSYHSDNYEDGAAYLAIAGECAERDLGITDEPPMPSMPGGLRDIGNPTSRYAEVQPPAPLHQPPVPAAVPDPI